MNSTCQLVAILNLTPDSFSGVGPINADAAIQQIYNYAKDGAHIVDIGAESTRPGATPLTHEQEWSRLEELLLRLQERAIPISLDTRHAETAGKALALNAVDWVNDVSGFQNADMLEHVSDSVCKLVVMHSITVPADKYITLPKDTDVILLLQHWAEKILERLSKAGIQQERIILDPGIGFGKTAAQSWQIIHYAHKLVQDFPVNWLFGHSRKSFLSDTKPALQRDAETLKVSQQLASQGVQYLRVHEIPQHARMLTNLIMHSA